MVSYGGGLLGSQGTIPPPSAGYPPGYGPNGMCLQSLLVAPCEWLAWFLASSSPNFVGLQTVPTSTSFISSPYPNTPTPPGYPPQSNPFVSIQYSPLQPQQIGAPSNPYLSSNPSLATPPMVSPPGISPVQQVLLQQRQQEEQQRALQLAQQEQEQQRAMQMAQKEQEHQRTISYSHCSILWLSFSFLLLLWLFPRVFRTLNWSSCRF